MNLVELPYRYRVRGGTASDLATVNEIPLERELVFETDTRKWKLGDGVTNYNALPYGGGAGAALPPGGTAGQVLSKLTATDGDAGWVTLPRSIAIGRRTGGVARLPLTANGSLQVTRRTGGVALIPTQA